jgi:hypothetical protein
MKSPRRKLEWLEGERGDIPVQQMERCAACVYTNNPVE